MISVIGVCVCADYCILECALCCTYLGIGVFLEGRFVYGVGVCMYPNVRADGSGIVDGFWG